MNKIFAYISFLIVAAVGGMILYGIFVPPPLPELANADYSKNHRAACPAGSRAGASGFTEDLKSAKGTHYFVRTPKNYDPTRAHPLLMVFSPGDRGGLSTERFTKLTTDATRAGYIVAYADNRPRTAPSTHRPISREWIMELGTIPAHIAKKWCIDEKRIFLSGHSNGGTASTALTILPDSPISAAAIVVSGAGWAEDNFAEFKCPTPRPVMIMHSKDDGTFPGYGPHAAKFWSICNKCQEKGVKRPDGCIAYNECSAQTLYCEGEGSHVVWPQRNKAVFEFLSSATR